MRSRCTGYLQKNEIEGLAVEVKGARKRKRRDLCFQGFVGIIEDLDAALQSCPLRRGSRDKSRGGQHASILQVAQWVSVDAEGSL